MVVLFFMVGPCYQYKVLEIVKSNLTQTISKSGRDSTNVLVTKGQNVTRISLNLKNFTQQNHSHISISNTYFKQAVEM